MGQETDAEYFARRAHEERQKAESAVDPLGYRVHIEFARHYENRILTFGQDNAEPSASPSLMMRELGGS